MDFRPTLLVGVGGTGCQIAEGVAATARAREIGRQGTITVLGVDTDQLCVISALRCRML